MNPKRSTRAFICAALFVLSVAAWAQDCSASPKDHFATIDFPGASFTEATGINARSQIAGWYVDNNLGSHGFLLTNGRFHRIDPPGSVGTTVSGINDRGEITGTFFDLERGSGRGFLFNHDRFTLIDFPGAQQTAALGINNRGEIVGFYVDENSEVHAYLLSETGFSTIPFAVVPAGINDRGEIVVGAVGLLKNGKLKPVVFPGSVFTEANGINDRGQITGDFGDGTAEHGFIWSSGRFTQLDVPGATLTQPMGISVRGEIVGYYIGGGVVHGFWAAATSVCRKYTELESNHGEEP